MKKASKLATSPISYFLARCANNDLADIDSNAKKRKKKRLHGNSPSNLVLLPLLFSHSRPFPFFYFLLKRYLQLLQICVIINLNERVF